MKKKLIASVLALATCFAFGGALAGCSGKDGAAGANGTNGANGKSAYQIWLDNGNTGSEVDFLNSLKGSGSATCNHENMKKAELIDVVDLMSEDGYPVHTSTYNEETGEWEYTNGTVLNVCVDCGYSKITEEVYHVMKNTERASTCTEEGFKGSECLICSYHEGEILPLGEHVIDETKIYPVVEQDYRNLCEEGGLVATVCTECNTAFTTELDATGHTWDVSELVYDASANVLKGACKNYCKETKTIALPETDEGYIVKLPSCKTGAAQEKVYSIYVNEKGQLSKEEAEGYTLIEIKKVPAVACHTVVVDGKTYEMNKEVYALNGENNYAAAIKEFNNDKAACNVNNGLGGGYFICSECGDDISVTTKKVHEYDEVTVTTPAQCNVEGVAKGKCIHCETLNENIPVPALVHDLAYDYDEITKRIVEYCARENCNAQLGSYAVVGEPVIVKSTCEKKGTITFTAIINNDEVEVTKDLPLAAHKVTVDGVDYVMDKTVYELIGEGNYAAAIKEFNNNKAACDVNNGLGGGYFICSVCDAEESVTTHRNHVAKEGTEKQNVVNATCTTDGSYDIDCQNCEGLAHVVVPATGHNYKYTLTKTNDIFTLAWVCENGTCGDNGSEQVYARVDGETEGVVYTKVTATACGNDSYDFYQYYNEDGVILATLKLNVISEPHKVIVEGKTYVMDKEVYDINEYPFIKEFNNDKATCGTNATTGQGRYSCSICDDGEEYVVTTSRTCKYDFTAADVEVEDAGCTIAGTVAGKCTACGETGSKEIPAKGHTLVATATADIYGNVTASVKCSVENCDGNRDDVAVSVELPNLFAKDADGKAYYAVKELIAENCTNDGEDEYTITKTVTVDGKDYAVNFVIKYTVDATGHYAKDGEYYTYYSYEEEVIDYETDREGKLWKVTYKATIAHSAYICGDCGNMFETSNWVVEESKVEVSRVELQ